MKEIIKIGTRGSKLALSQSNYAAGCLREKYPELQIETVIITTTGDKILDVPLAKIGGKGLFTTEIERAILDRKVDFAVHSLKDMPTELEAGLELAALTVRQEARDAFVSIKYKSLAELPEGSRIGTSSLRRQAQLLALRPDLAVVNLRGNVDTRLKKLEAGEFDAIILAAAGLMRLGQQNYITELLPADIMLPAVGQGILAIETRAGDTEMRELLSCLHDEKAGAAATAERAFLRRINGGCQVPVGVFAVTTGDRLEISAVIAALDGSKVCRRKRQGDLDTAESLGKILAEELLQAGGQEILDEVNSTRE